MSKTQIYGVVLPVEIAQKARLVAASHGLSRSGLMRRLLENYLLTAPVPELPPALEPANGLYQGPGLDNPDRKPAALNGDRLG